MMVETDISIQERPPIQSNLYCKNTADRTQLSKNVGREKEKEKEKEMLRESRDENQ